MKDEEVKAGENLDMRMEATVSAKTLKGEQAWSVQGWEVLGGWLE